MPTLNSLDDLLVHELQDIYHAEGQILTALPKMAKAASNPELKQALEEHELLGQNLDAEETTDQKLTSLAEGVIFLSPRTS